MKRAGIPHREDVETHDVNRAGGFVGNPTLVVGHERAMDLDDSVLWSRARAGDPDAFGLLFQRHARAIYNYCFRRVGNWAAAEDLVSIVFLEAWRRRSNHSPIGKELPLALRDRHERRSEPASRRATLRGGVAARCGA